MAKRKLAVAAASSFEQILRSMVAEVMDARQDVERLVGTHLPNVAHYAVLGRMDALAADVTHTMADVLAPLMTEK